MPSPSPSVKIEIIGGKVCLRQNIAGQQTFESKKFVKNTQQWFALLPQLIFPTNNLNFHWRWRWWDWIQTVYRLKFFLLQNLDIC